MVNRRFEMHQCLNIILRMRLGESDRALEKAGLIGRKKAKKVCRIAGEQQWMANSNFTLKSGRFGNFDLGCNRSYATAL